MGLNSIHPSSPLLNQTVSGVTPVLSGYFKLEFYANPQAYWLINVGAGLTATFQVMESLDGVNFVDSGQILPSASGSAVKIPARYSDGAPYVCIQVSPSSGSGTVVINGAAKGVK